MQSSRCAQERHLVGVQKVWVESLSPSYPSFFGSVYKNVRTESAWNHLLTKNLDAKKASINSLVVVVRGWASVNTFHYVHS